MSIPKSVTSLRLAAGLLPVMLLAGCQSYVPDPLPEAPDFVASLPSTPARPLSLAEVATLAVERNPDLVSSRAKADISSAQAIAAGLLPDPQLNASLETPTQSGFANGYMLGLSEDLQSLITQPSRKAAAQAAADQAKLSVLWDEWQTAQKAASLAIQRSFSDRKLTLLDKSGGVLWDQQKRSSLALDAGNSTLEAAGADLAAALDVESQRASAAREALATDRGLKQLLNLDPAAVVTIADLPDPPAITKEGLTSAIKGIVKTRPDLLALQAGYRSQEEEVRQSILKQFPAITFGFDRAADAENVHTIGLSVSMNLPIFGNTQAAIKVQSATRAQLKAEYQSRLDSTAADAWRIWQNIELLRSQISLLEEKLPQFRQMAEASAQAHANGDLVPATYVLLQISLQTREVELLDLKTSLWNDTVALNTLLGTPYPASAGQVPAASP
jgi:outer membrane protein TolC